MPDQIKRNPVIASAAKQSTAAVKRTPQWIASLRSQGELCGSSTS